MKLLIPLTFPLWSVHGQAQRCVYRALDEYSPSFAAAGVVRPLIVTAGGGGLFLNSESLSDMETLRAQVARTPLSPHNRILRRIVRGCLHDRVFDDQAAMYEGCRRIAVPIGQHGAIACAFMARRLRIAAARESAIAAMRAVAESLS